jgi:hypothetical protein
MFLVVEWQMARAVKKREHAFIHCVNYISLCLGINDDNRSMSCFLSVKGGVVGIGG